VLQCYTGGFSAVFGPQLGEDIADVYAHRCRAERQRLGDLFVGLAVDQQGQHLPLAVGQVVPRRGWLARRLDQDLHGGRVKGRTTLAGSPDGLGELGGARVLEQVTGGPCRNACWIMSSSKKLVKAMTCTSGQAARMRAVAVGPSMPGMTMSISTTSGWTC
jgi:hypothetical protein